MNKRGGPQPPRDERFDTAVRAMRGFPDTLASALAKDEVTRGVHVTRYLDEPVHTRFGTFTRKWEYEAGCEPLSALVASGAGEVRATLTTSDGERKLVSLGQTPPGWRPEQEDTEIATATRPDDFIMGIVDIDDTQRPVGRPQVSYLGIADLADVRIVRGEEFPIGANMGQPTIFGRVEAVYALVP